MTGHSFTIIINNYINPIGFTQSFKKYIWTNIYISLYNGFWHFNFIKHVKNNLNLQSIPTNLKI